MSFSCFLKMSLGKSTKSTTKKRGEAGVQTFPEGLGGAIFFFDKFKDFLFVPFFLTKLAPKIRRITRHFRGILAMPNESDTTMDISLWKRSATFAFWVVSSVSIWCDFFFQPHEALES